MDELNIGLKIKELRTIQNLTQEKLANMIGLTSGAISKWENGVSTPDITLLAPLARALNTSLDALLSFEKELSKERVLQIKQELIELFLKQGYDTGKVLCRKYLKEYPSSTYLKLTLASVISVYGSLANGPLEISEEEIKGRMKFSLELLYQVAESNNSNDSKLALYSIASLEMMLENYDKSEEALKKIDNVYLDTLILHISLYEKQGKKEEAKDLCKKGLLQDLTKSISMLSILSRFSKEEKEYDKALFYLGAASLLEDNFDFGLFGSSMSSMLNYSKIYLEINDKITAAKWFKKYIDNLIESNSYNYDNHPYFKGIKIEVKEENLRLSQLPLLKSFLKEEDFKSLTGIPSYDDSIEKIKKFILKNEVKN